MDKPASITLPAMPPIPDLDVCRVLGLLWQSANGHRNEERLQDTLSAVWGWMHDNIGPEIGSSFLDAIPASGAQQVGWLKQLEGQVASADLPGRD